MLQGSLSVWFPHFVLEIQYSPNFQHISVTLVRQVLLKDLQSMQVMPVRLVGCLNEPVSTVMCVVTTLHIRVYLLHLYDKLL